MTRSAPRSIDQYLRQLREELAGEDAALIQDALYDAEEYLRAEVAAHPDKSESDVLELIASTYGAPDEVAAAYRVTEAKVKAAMTTPRKVAKSGAGAFFGVFLDPRAYTSLFFMLLSLATGVIEVAGRFDWFGLPEDVHMNPAWLDSLWALPLVVLVGVLLLTVLMHLARGVGRLHAMYAKALLVAPTAA
jgi:hypothetical protein